MSRILAVASGKGGTGKTSLSVNLSLALARMGRRVCLLDADLGLSNVDVLLGVSPELTLEHVLYEDVPLEQAVFPVAPGLDMVPGGSGVARLADLPPGARQRLAGEFAKLEGYDYLLVDGSPGISRQVISLCLACPELLVVVNPDPASLTDAYALVKVLSENGLRRGPHLAINRVRSAAAAGDIFSRLRGAMAKYLKLDARYLGYIPQDPHVSAAAARQRPLVELYPACEAGRAVLGMARDLDAARTDPGAGQASPASFLNGAVARLRETAPMRPEAALPAKTRLALEAAIELAGRMEASDAAQREQLEQLKALLDVARNGLGPGVIPGPTGTPGQAGRTGSAGETGQAYHPDQPGARGQTVQAAHAEKTGQPDPASHSVRTGQEGTPSRAVHAGKTGRYGGDDRSEPVPVPSMQRSKPVRAAVISSDEAMGDILAESLGSSGIAVQAPGGGPAEAAVVYWRGEPEALSRRLAALGDVSFVYVRGVDSREPPVFSRKPSEVMDMPFRLEDLAWAVRRCAGKMHRGN